MEKDNILMEMSLEKNRLIKEFMKDFLGHDPSDEEKKLFTFMNSLKETQIYFKGNLVDTLEYRTTDYSAI